MRVVCSIAVFTLVVGAGCTTGPDAAGANANDGSEVAVSCSTNDTADKPCLLSDAIVANPPSCYSRGTDRTYNREGFLTDVVKKQGRAIFESLLERMGFVDAYGRTFLPGAGPRPGRADEDIIYACAECLASSDQASMPGLWSTRSKASWPSTVSARPAPRLTRATPLGADHPTP